MSLLKSFYSAIGSHSSDFSDTESVKNPLPPCPSSPNCVRITKEIDASRDSVFAASVEALKSMLPQKVNVEENNYKIDTVFRVFFFRDDMTVLVSKRDSSSTYLHIRSASREGYTDLGVNTRRVKRFLKRLHNQLD